MSALRDLAIDAGIVGVIYGLGAAVWLLCPAVRRLRRRYRLR